MRVGRRGPVGPEARESSNTARLTRRFASGPSPPCGRSLAGQGGTRRARANVRPTPMHAQSTLPWHTAVCPLRYSAIHHTAQVHAKGEAEVEAGVRAAPEIGSVRIQQAKLGRCRPPASRESPFSSPSPTTGNRESSSRSRDSQCHSRIINCLHFSICASSLRRGHANLLCTVPVLIDDPRRESDALLASS